MSWSSSPPAHLNRPTCLTRVDPQVRPTWLGHQARLTRLGRRTRPIRLDRRARPSRLGPHTRLTTLPESLECEVE